MRHWNFSAILLVCVIMVCSEAAAMASSWYVIKDSGNENIKYLKDETGGYVSGNWTKAQSSGILSGLLNELDSTIAVGKAVSIYGGFNGTE